MPKLVKNVAVVTGSSKGIGKATALEFAKAGYSIVLNAREEQELKKSAEDISKSALGLAHNSNNSSNNIHAI